MPPTYTMAEVREQSVEEVMEPICNLLWGMRVCNVVKGNIDEMMEINGQGRTMAKGKS